MTTVLEVVRAGAGSGKTTDLCKTVASAVAAGLDPARILATTFTREAAAELKGRIQTELLKGTDGNWGAAHKHADRLELAAIGTVHSVAHQLLLRYAILLGLSPRLDVLVETGSDRVLRDLLGMVEPNSLDTLNEVAERLSIDGLNNLILNLLVEKRCNRIPDDNLKLQMTASAERVCQLLAPSGPDEQASSIDQLYELAQIALVQIEALTSDTTKDTRGAVEQLSRMIARRDPAWSNYVYAQKIKGGKRSGADAQLQALRTYAGRVRRIPALHADIRTFAVAIADAVLSLGAHYNAYKAERGLVDYTDLELLFLSLLEDDEIAGQLRHDFDLVLVDEFQDTNPLQLAIFQALRPLTHRCRWVGDPKQAIFGFRGTDPQLVNDIWENTSNAERPELSDNYRSQKGLVQLVGRLFEPAFGAEAIQKPIRPPNPRGIERWLFNSSNQPGDALALACGITQLQAEGVRLGDIAVLERTNRLLQTDAQAFDELRIPYLIESPGLLSTREGALVLAGLRLVADRSDALAAATVMHILSSPETATPDWLNERLSALRADEAARKGDSALADFVPPWAGDSRLSPLEELDPETLSPSVVVQCVIQALAVPTLISKWGDAARRGSHLDSFHQHAVQYEEFSLETGSAATLTGLIAYLEQLAEDEEDMRIPPLGHNAVTLTTYHTAKGLEWPVVILSGLNSGHAPKMWSPVVTGGQAADEDPLAHRVLRYWIWPFGYSDGPFPKLLSGSGLEIDAIHSPEGQDQQRRESDESLRLLYVGFTRAKMKLILAHRDGTSAWLQGLTAADSLLDSSLPDGEHPLPGIETTYVVRRLDPANADSCRQPQRDRERWLAPAEAPHQRLWTSRYRQPTSTSPASEQFSFQAVNLPGTANFPSGAKDDQYSAIGDAVHAYFAALPSLRSQTAAQKNMVAERCLVAFSVSGVLTSNVLVECGDQFVEWVDRTYPGAQWFTEAPVTAPHVDGSQWSGIIDLLLCLPDGRVVIIDHKSAPIRRHDCLAKAMTFAGQLASYQEIVGTIGHPVQASWIHFPLPGVLAEMAESAV